jgi:hypothetical protein
MMLRGMLGGCLMAIGLLIAGATGLCTLMFVRVDSGASLLRALASAGLPFFFGIALIIAGIVIVASGRRGGY